MNTVAIIPARGGSKGIPGKNIKMFCGHPLMTWSIACAQKCASVSAVYVSTDSPEIAAIAREYGAGVIDRPAAIAGDDASSESALLHAVDVLEKDAGAAPDAILFLQATSPLREVSELDGAFGRFQEAGFDSLFSAAELEHMLIWTERGGELRSFNYDFHNRKRRQEIEERDYVETGSFYITKTSILREMGNRLGGHIGIWSVPFWKSFEIDKIEDMDFCQMLMKAYGLDSKEPAKKSP